VTRACAQPIAVIIGVVGAAVVGIGAVVAMFIRGNAREDERVRAEATRIIDAVRAYHGERGAYPDRLEELVPTCLPELPRARYGDPMGFTYDASGGRHVLGWTAVAPFGRPYYVFEEDRWGYLD